MKTLMLSKEDVASVINLEDIISAVEECYKAFCLGEVIQPDYMGFEFDEPRGGIDFKAGYCSRNEKISMKSSSGGFKNNVSDFGIPANMGTVLLYDARNCALQCIMDGSLITGLRTGAAGAVSVKYLARKNSEIISSIGTGTQARNQIKAISLVMDIKEIHAFDSYTPAVESFKKDIEGEFGIPVIIEKSMKEAVEVSDIVVSTTRGKGPLIEASWIKKGTHIVAIGADCKGKQEYEPEIFKNAKIVNDSIEQCISKGETCNGIEKGVISKEDIYAEIGEIVLGKKRGRTNDDEITIFDSTGMAVQDNLTADMIYNRAVSKGIGIEFEFFK
ncbi:ornithine cyclodeaminase family protein [Lachnospiraceae bacterium NSJ-143]|nr:ornithine cyclodeaminase family protein [Lachnospiraceae bacterium NSJ-143]